MWCPQTPVQYVQRTRATLVTSISRGRRWLVELVSDSEQTSGHRKARGLQHSEGQHDDLARLPCTRSRQGSDRGSLTPRHGGGSSLRLARRMVSPAPDARLHPSVSFTIEPVSARDSLYFRETGFRGQRQRRRNSRPNSPIPLRRPSPRGAHRQFGAIRQPPGNCSKRWTAWWAREKCPGITISMASIVQPTQILRRRAKDNLRNCPTRDFRFHQAR